jgi:hypothetical protein
VPLAFRFYAEGLTQIGWLGCSDSLTARPWLERASCQLVVAQKKIAVGSLSRSHGFRLAVGNEPHCIVVGMVGQEGHRTTG